MKLSIISDTHGSHEKVTVPDADVLIHCGDWTAMDSDKEWGDFITWLLDQPARHKILIHGNHDNPRWVEAGRYLNTDLTILHDSAVEIEGITFYGSPYTPKFYNWHWMLPRNSEELAKKWEKIPDNTQVLITHGPPQGILDIAGDERCGCELLEKRVRQLENLKLHCFGHIHSGYGQSFSGKSANAAIMTEQYRPENKPIEVEI